MADQTPQPAASIEGIGHLFRNRETLLGFGLVGVVLIMMVPLNAVFIDAFLVLSMAVSLVVFLIAVYTNKATEFTVFPTVLLIVTIFP
jgi:flagellar biosynthesis protein FlhA